MLVISAMVTRVVINVDIIAPIANRTRERERKRERKRGKIVS